MEVLILVMNPLMKTIARRRSVVLCYSRIIDYLTRVSCALFYYNIILMNGRDSHANYCQMEEFRVTTYTVCTINLTVTDKKKQFVLISPLTSP